MWHNPQHFYLVPAWVFLIWTRTAPNSSRFLLARKWVPNWNWNIISRRTLSKLVANLLVSSRIWGRAYPWKFSTIPWFSFHKEHDQIRPWRCHGWTLCALTVSVRDMLTISQVLNESCHEWCCEWSPTVIINNKVSGFNSNLDQEIKYLHPSCGMVLASGHSW